MLVHGTPTLDTLYWTQDRSDEFCIKMAAGAGLKTGDMIAFGYTHKPWHREIEGMHFGNTGRIGRPTDGKSHAGYVRVEFANGVVVEHVRVPYDVESTVPGVRAAGLPDDFVECLRSGVAPAATSSA